MRAGASSLRFTILQFSILITHLPRTNRYTRTMKPQSSTATRLASLLAALCAFAATTSLPGQDIKLPAPQRTGGMPLMEALAKRSTARAFDASRDLTPQQISSLLWAAFGINRDDGKRTAPTANNRQELDLYVLLKTGSYRYEPKDNTLVLVAEGDKREIGGTQPFVKNAPVTVLIVADFTRMNGSDTPGNRQTASTDAGFVSQNIYLYCASEGLANGTRGSVDRAKVAAALSFKPTQWVALGHSAGYAP